MHCYMNSDYFKILAVMHLVIAVVCVVCILAGILRAGILGAVRRILAGIVGIVCIVGVVCIAAVVCIVCHNFVSS